MSERGSIWEGRYERGAEVGGQMSERGSIGRVDMREGQILLGRCERGAVLGG